MCREPRLGRRCARVSIAQSKSCQAKTVNMGGSDMAPQTPQRSDRPGGAVAVLDSRSLAITVRSRAHSRGAPMVSARVTDSGFVAFGSRFRLRRWAAKISLRSSALVVREALLQLVDHQHAGRHRLGHPQRLVEILLRLADVLVVEARRLHLEQRQPPLARDGAREQRLAGPWTPSSRIARSASNVVKPRSRSTSRSRSAGDRPIDTGRSRAHSATTRLTTLLSSSASGRSSVNRAVSGASSGGSSTFTADIMMTRRSWPKAGARSRHLRATAESACRRWRSAGRSGAGRW